MRPLPQKYLDILSTSIEELRHVDIIDQRPQSETSHDSKSKRIETDPLIKRKRKKSREPASKRDRRNPDPPQSSAKVGERGETSGARQKPENKSELHR